MATLTNRSPFAVTVRGNVSLYREFAVFRRKEARRYCDDLMAQGYKATLKQLRNAFQVKARDKGYPPFCATFDTYTEAEKTLKKLESERALKVFRDYGAAMRHTVAELVERYIEEVCPQHKGAESEIYRLRRLVREVSFMKKTLAALTTEDLQRFIRDRKVKDKVKGATIDRDLDVLRQALNYAADVWKIAPSESPFVGLRRPQYTNERDRRLVGDEEERILKAARGSANPFYEPVILLALETAMRRSEILSLQWRNIDLEQCSALLPDTKNGRSRKVPLSSVSRQVLAALPRDGDHVFPLTANALKLAWRRILAEEEIENLHFHDLRHEATSRLAESGLYTLIELQAVTGHRDTRMLLRYSHLCTRKLADKMDQARTRVIREYEHRGRKRQVVKVSDRSVLSKLADARAEKPIAASNVLAFRRR